MLLSGFDALFSQGSCVPAWPPSPTSLPHLPTIFIGLLAKGKKKQRRRQRSDMEGDFKLTHFFTARYFRVIDGRWQALKINLSINSAHCSLLWAFTAVCWPAECILAGHCRQTWPSPYRCKLFIYCYYLDVSNAALWVYGTDFIDPPFCCNINCLSMIQYENTRAPGGCRPERRTQVLV